MVVEEEGLLDRINSNRVLPVVVVVMVAEVVGFKASSNRLVAVVAVEEGFTAIKLVVAVVLVAEVVVMEEGEGFKASTNSSVAVVVVVAEVEGFKASTNSNLVVVVVAEVVAVEVVLVAEGFNRSNKNNNCGPKRETPLPPPSKLTTQLGLQSFLQPPEPTIRTLIQVNLTMVLDFCCLQLLS